MVQKGGILPITAHTVERLLYLTSVSEQWTILLQLWLLKTVLMEDMMHSCGWLERPLFLQESDASHLNLS